MPAKKGRAIRLHEVDMTDPAIPLTPLASGQPPLEKWNPSGTVLSYECGHTTDAATGLRIGSVPAGAPPKEILTVCPECAAKEPRGKRTKPYDWSDITGHSI